MCFHFIVVMVVFRRVMYEEGWQWLSVLFTVDALLIDSTQNRINVIAYESQLNVAYSRMADMANHSLRKLYVDMCDADAALDPVGKICEPAPRLATMLGMTGKTLVGRTFVSLLDLDDCEKFREYLQEAMA